jgi:hypothetical protein
MSVRILISPKLIAGVMIAIALGFVLIDLYVQYGRYTPGMNHRIRLDELFHLGKEANIPTWYSATLLLLASLLLFLIAGVKQNLNEMQWVGWFLLATIFLYLSADETALLHERIAMYISSRFPGSPLMTFGWILPGIIAIGIIGLAYVPFLLALPAKTRRLIIASGVIYLGGAIVTEFAAIPYEFGKTLDMGFALLVALEELMEMCGVILLIYTLLDFLQEQLRDRSLTLVYK